jgi:hypothetical protein
VQPLVPVRRRVDVINSKHWRIEQMTTEQTDKEQSDANRSVVPPGADVGGQTEVEIVYTWEDGREEVRYRRPFPSPGAWKLIRQVSWNRTLHRDSRYSWRFRKP